MSRRAQALIRYDGPALAGHEMDVQDLAPALLALADLCKAANEIFNGDQASVRVLVRADIPQKCFQFEIQIIQTLYEQLTTLVSTDGVRSAKELLEWIGIIGGAGGGTLFALYKFMFGKKSKDQTVLETRAADGSVTIQIVGDGNSITVPPEVYRLASDQRVLDAAKKVLAPLEQEGYETLEFQSQDTVIQSFNREEAARIIEASGPPIVTKTEREQVSKITTTVRVKKPVWEGNSKWTIVYKRAVDAKIADEAWLDDYQRGRVVFQPGSRLIVNLEERVPTDEDGLESGPATYTILKVIGIEKPPDQGSLFPVKGPGKSN